ncbi:unnamed protein product [Tetraodon nigroviridis]|uniref:(spotted green pufferfish) hypothetical protein n=1 Tax=Tetraodon nigroviridis TaxID=99883 RepID=Q4RYL8_TETNG|nr:unnamed protein product [Tetraodon nigroviridis]
MPACVFSARQRHCILLKTGPKGLVINMKPCESEFAGWISHEAKVRSD